MIQKLPGKYEEIHFIRTVARCIKLSRGFTMRMSCLSRPAPIIICRGNFQESFTKRSFRNRSSLQIRDATRVTLGDRFPKGILLTTQDHALLTTNFRPPAPEYKTELSHLEERAQRAHYRTCYAWHARTCADRRARRVFARLGNFQEIFRKRYFTAALAAKI